MRGTIPPLLQYVFIEWCLIKHRDFTFIIGLHHRQTSVSVTGLSITNSPTYAMSSEWFLSMF